MALKRCLQLHTQLISEQLPGVDTIWIIGDTFVDNTYDTIFRQISENESFAKANFEIKKMASNRYHSNYTSALGRIRNTFAKMINQNDRLPKFVVIVLENDVTMSISDACPDGEFHDTCRRMAKWLINEVRKLFMTKNDYLPKRGKRETKLVWIIPTRHDNYNDDFDRKVFGKYIQEFARFYENNIALELKQLWDCHENNIFDNRVKRFTNDGLYTFYRALDRTIWYADTIINKSVSRKPGREVERKLTKSTKYQYVPDDAEQRPSREREGSTPSFFKRKRDDSRKFSKSKRRKLPAPSKRL